MKSARMMSVVLMVAAALLVWSGAGWAGTWVETRLTASDGATSDNFGWSSDIVGDYAIVGAPSAWVGGQMRGAAYVYHRTGSTWTQEAKLVASDGAASDYFGFSVATDGTYAVVGARMDNSQNGSAYVFKRSGTTWTQIKRLAVGGAGRLGESVAIDGDTILAGAMSTGPNYRGSAYAFRRDTGGADNWGQEAQLPFDPPDPPTDDWYNTFGTGIGLTGNTAIVGAGWDFQGTSNTRAGNAYIYTRSGSVWTHSQTLNPGGLAGYDYYGMSAAIDGTTAVVGAPLQPSGVRTGSFYAWRYNGSSWISSSELTIPGGVNNDGLGNSVDVHGDTIVVAAPGRTGAGGAGTGAVYMYTWNGSAWVLSNTFTPSAGAPDAMHFGGQIVEGASNDLSQPGKAISYDGTRLVVGAPLGNGLAIDSGTAYIYDYQVLGDLRVFKFDDANGDGLADWEFTITGPGIAGSFVGTTDENGFLTDPLLTNLPVGNYTIIETPQANWDCTTYPTYSVVYTLVEGGVALNTVSFGNQYVAPASVPEPVALGLIGLALFAIRRRRI